MALTSVGGRDVRQRAVEASMSLPLPDPSPVCSINTYGKTDYALVNAHTWFSTPASTFEPITKRVNAGGTWVEVTALPVGVSPPPPPPTPSPSPKPKR